MASFKDNFIKPLLALGNRDVLDTMQEESSTVSIASSNFSSTTSSILTTDKLGSIVSANSAFSFALDPVQAAGRSVIKSSKKP
jgi:hypothetical protein